MQALANKPSFGWAWIRAGWRLFRGQPFGFIALLVFYWMLVLTASTVVELVAKAFGSSVLIATLGSTLVAVFTPALTVGFMQACRDASGPNGKSVNPLVLFAPFRAGRAVLKQLMWIGVVEVVALTLILTLTRAVEPPPAPTSPTTTVEQRSANGATTPPVKAEDAAKQADAEREQQRDAIVRSARWFPFYLIVELVLWYAPVLAAWHGLSAPKAIFFSVVAVWRNLGAFFVYGLGWMAVCFVLAFLFAGVAAMLAGPNVAAVVSVPLVVLLLTWMFCSKWPTYASVFVDPEDRTRTSPVDDPVP